MNHDLADYRCYVAGDPIVIGKNSWIASAAIILPEVVLGEHTVVAAGAVVTRSFPEGNQILAGCPAKVLRRLAPYAGQEGQ
jgi:acetyltransferase-like isoleucine patch superfamily enzyme